ncbi:beta-lactamase domain-containing protein 2-like [Saccostrea echinata]|uniref:beta-lactamase domain-containing protein 2-like n=1 Tax=Saccostrea echinata TaxID=191078 RepID=UPI002A7EA666|nr:beta-lactamase domain-containing protein 2-like [Saccostrea echinata]
MGVLKLSLFVLVLSGLLYIYKEYKRTENLQIPFDGRFHPDFKEVVNNFRENFESGIEIGASLSIFHEGKSLVDVWGGYADVTTKRPWTEDRLSILFSATKGVTALLIAVFVDKGWLDYKKPVAYYWPEFGENGKHEITVEMLLSHQGGLSITNGTFPIQWIEEQPEKVYRFLEQQTPYWKPGTAYYYHSITYGLFVDSLLAKADPKHRRVDQIFKEEIGDKFGIEFYNGLPYHLYYRTARYEPTPFTSVLWKTLTSLDFEPLLTRYKLMDPESIMGKSFISGTDAIPVDTAFNIPEYTKIPQSSLNGYSNARNLAKLYGIIANGGKNDEGTLLSEKIIQVLEEPLTSGVSLDGMTISNFGRGVIALIEDNQLIGIGHPGYGGQIAYADTRRKTGFAYVTSRIKEVRRGAFYEEVKQYRDIYYKCLKKHLQNKKA